MTFGSTISPPVPPTTSAVISRAPLRANEITVLSHADLAALMQFGDYVEAVAQAFRLHAEGQSVLPPPMHIPAEGGGFHVKAAHLGGYVAGETQFQFSHNPPRGFPPIPGALLLFRAGGAPPAPVYAH